MRRQTPGYPRQDPPSSLIAGPTAPGCLMAALPPAPTGCRWESGLQPCKAWGCFSRLLPCPTCLQCPYLSVPVPPGDDSSLLHPALRLWERTQQPGPLGVVGTRVSRPWGCRDTG